MKSTWIIALATLAGLQLPAQEIDYGRLETEAERLHAEGSYAASHALYLKADALPLPPAKARWVDFRIADTLWRAQAGSATADPTAYEKASEMLSVLVRDAKRDEDRDRVWAEVHESLGDFHWLRRDARNWGAAWPQYQLALDWWAGSKDLDLARDRYLGIVWRASSPPGREEWYSYGAYGNNLPLPVLENALRLASTEGDRARAQYLIAMTIRNQGGDAYTAGRAREAFEAAIAAGRSTDWYDDALYHYAEWLLGRGRITELEDGSIREEPDYVRALELFERFVSEHRKGQSRYYDGARQHIEQIRKPALNVAVPEIFLPGAEIEYSLGWRNLKKIDLALYSVDLVRDPDFGGDPSRHADPWGPLNLAGKEKVLAWSKDTEDRGDHAPGSLQLRIDEKVPTGAYVLEARADNLAARDIVLVTDATLVLKTSRSKALVYFADARNGSPIPKARVALWDRRYDGKEWRVERLSAETDASGLAVVDLRFDSQQRTVFAAANLGGRQAFATGNAYGHSAEPVAWRIYAYTDRPAYRPGDKAEWKLIARTHDGRSYGTPANRSIRWQITDPRGAKAGEGTSTLNAFGSAWGSLELTEAMPLGQYTIAFWDDGRHIGQAQLLRLEEYKLPEFQVTVKTPEEGGKRKTFRLGDVLQATISAEYYFGGPVAGGSVEVVVHQKPYWFGWSPEREYPWYYEDQQARRWGGWGRGQVVKRETLRLDSAGEARVAIETPRGGGQDLEYVIEARVTDSSRREVSGQSAVRVTLKRYAVHARAEHNLYRPGDRARILFKAVDANGGPVEVDGRVQVTRDTWVEVWVSPEGKEVRGRELEDLRRKGPVFPPDPRWRPRFQGYEHEVVLTRSGVKTGKEGDAELVFTAEREGYYRVSWRSQDSGGPPVTAETFLWVCTSSSTDLGYRRSAVEIIADRETFRAGEKAPVMLSVPAGGRHVLFSVESEDLLSWQVVHVEGSVKLLELDIGESHIPNSFLGAVLPSDLEVHMDTKEIVVPPVKQFLTVDVALDKPEYLPRDEGKITVTTRDHEGKPVRSEVSLAVVDESVYYIQQELAGDPRSFFFGEKRPHLVQTTTTLQQKRYARDETRVSRDGKQDWREESEEKESRFGGLRQASLQKSRRGLALADAPASPAAAMEADALGASLALDEMAGAKAAAPKREALANEGGEEPAVQVRTDFRATAVWVPDVVTDETGKATVAVKFPDSLTSWRATTRAAATDSRFGHGTSSARTRLPLIVRLQAPRFFVAGDSVVISAVINNNTDRPLSVDALLDASGLTVEGSVRDGKAAGPQPGPISVDARGEARADWIVHARQAGSARLKVTARARTAEANAPADAMEKTFTVHEHGIEKFLSRSGKMRGDSATVRLDLPAERKAGSTSLVVQVAPSIAVTMLDALPYLADYPYGCTEQTLSRFLPAAITAKTLRDLGLDAAAVEAKLFGGIEPGSAGKTHPGGKKDLRKLDEMAQAGLARLFDFQHADGGWGWWKEGESDHFMTAYVVWGLGLAREAGLDVKVEPLDRGAAWLDKEIVEAEESPDLQAWMLHALACHAASKGAKASEFGRKALDNLWNRRDALNAYSRALFAIAVHKLGDAEKAGVLVRNLANGVKRDANPESSVVLGGSKDGRPEVLGTAHWGEDRLWWRWSEGGVESTAFVLRAILAIDPRNELVEPVMNWLVKNRRGAQWSNTRDTAIVVLALNDYLKASGEVSPEVEYDVIVNGQPLVSRKVTTAEALSAPSRFTVDARLIAEDANEVRIVRKSGKSALYFGVEAQFFSLEEPIAPAGNEIFVRRDYRKLVPKPTLLKGWIAEGMPLADRGSVRSGERVEVILTIEAKNNYEYLLFEDLKPAGLEAAQVQSGAPVYARELKSGALERAAAGGVIGADVENENYTGRSVWVYQELRDRKVASFIDKLPEGVWELRYEMRAEVPGEFHGLPLMAHAMYVPEIRANGAETRIKVEDADSTGQRTRRAVVGGE